MTHTGPMRDDQGDFSADRASSRPCPKCGAMKVTYRTWESSCGGYEDYKYTCSNCRHTWWVDGIDS